MTRHRRMQCQANPRIKAAGGLILVFFTSSPVRSTTSQDRLLSGNGQAPGTEIGRCTDATGLDEGASTGDGCTGFGSGARISLGTDFFAAIVFAGFLAALRAAGLVPAAFFFAGAAAFVVRDRLAFAADRAVLLRAGAALREVLLARRDTLAFALSVLLATRFTARFAALRAGRFAALRAGRFTALRVGRFADFLPDDFDFAAIAHLRLVMSGLRPCGTRRSMQ